VGSAIDDAIDEICKCFVEIDHLIHVPFFEFLGQIPKGDETALFDLADRYSDAAQLYANHVNDISLHLADLYNNWSGDGAAMTAGDTLQNYVGQITQTAGSLNDMRGLVQETALNIEATKIMAIVNLVMLLYTLIQVIMTLIFSFGASALEGAGAIALCKEALAVAWRQLVAKIEALTVKGLLKSAATIALKRGLQFVAFTAVTKLGTFVIQSSEGQDPTWSWKEFGMELGDSGFQVGGVEVRPHPRGEDQLGVGAFPEQKIAEALLAAGTDQEVDVGSAEQ